jgi:hypothetical protein
MNREVTSDERKARKIGLEESARIELEKFTKTGRRSVKLVSRARIIFELDEANGRKPLTQEMIAERVGVSRQTINSAKQAFLKSDSITAFLQRKRRETPPVQPKITGGVEAHIIALACSPVPEGHAKWSLRLLAEKCVELNYIDSISFNSIRRVLKKRKLSRI